MINLELYRIFKIVADEKNITRASEILNISQPAVSKQIKNLENQLNIKLFDREKYGVKLNKNGIKLYEFIKEPIDIVNSAENIFKLHKDIKLGVQVNIPEESYNKGILEFYKNNNQTIVNIDKLTVASMFPKLEKQEIDLLYAKEYNESIYESNKIKFQPIKKIEDILIVNSNSKYLNKKMTKENIKQFKIFTLKEFTKEYINLTEKLNYTEEEKSNIQSVNFSSILELLKSRDIIAFLPKEYIKRQLENGEYSILNINLEFSKVKIGIYHNVNNMFEEQKELIRILKEMHRYN